MGAFGALWGLGLGVTRRCSACNDLRQGVHWVKRGHRDVNKSNQKGCEYDETGWDNDGGSRYEELL